MQHDFKKNSLSESSVNKNPFLQFRKWYSQAIKLFGEDASAMTLATATQNKPSMRTVFLRGYDENRFCFYTSYKSRKGKELLKNKNACLLFFWSKMQRQIKIEGVVQKLSAQESDNYFSSRPRGSQISAWASEQSKIISSRKILEERVKYFSEKFSDVKIPRPSHWGGFCLMPALFEFWQGRESRLHDRILFTRKKNGEWKIERLSP